MNMLQTASEWINKQRNNFLSERILYIHFGEMDQEFEFSATCGRTIFRAETDYGITVRVQSTDFLISADQVPFIPVQGDEIIYRNKRFEVLAPNNEPVWRWSDPSMQIMRIHTKEMGEANADR